MLSYFDTKVLNILERLSSPYSDLLDNDFCTKLRGPGALQARRTNALNILSWELRRVYQKPVVVLVDEYDSPMHSAIEHGYAALVRSLFSSIAATSCYSRPTISLLQYSVHCWRFVNANAWDTVDWHLSIEQWRSVCMYDGGHMQNSKIRLAVRVKPSQGMWKCCEL